MGSWSGGSPSVPRSDAPRIGLGVHEAGSNLESPRNVFGATDQDPAPKNTTTPSISPLPFDVQNVASDVTANDLRRKFTLERSKGKNASCTAYFPTNFEAHDWAGTSAGSRGLADRVLRQRDRCLAKGTSVFGIAVSVKL